MSQVRSSAGRNFDYPVPLNGGMAKNYLAQVEEDARRLRLLLRDDATLPAWVNAYVFTSADRLQIASRYMQHQAADLGGTALLSLPTSAQLRFFPSEYSYGAVSGSSIGKSQNGWPASPSASAIDIAVYPLGIPGCKQKSISLARGASGPLLEFIAWFNKNIEPITTAYGYNYREIRESSGTISNHGSGTAIDLNAEKHPFKVRNTFTPIQAGRILAKATELGLVWGGTWNRADDMHLELPSKSYGMVLKATSRVATLWVATSVVGLVGLAGFLAVKKWKRRKQLHG